MLIHDYTIVGPVLISVLVSNIIKFRNICSAKISMNDDTRVSVNIYINRSIIHSIYSYTWYPR